MPIRVARRNGEEQEEIAWLCGEDWELPPQIEALEQWLLEYAPGLEKGEYVADVGYGPRPGAAGGGTVVTLASMEAMLSVGMELYLSEYPGFSDEPMPVDGGG